MAVEPQVGDIGTAIKVAVTDPSDPTGNTPVDLSTATLMHVILLAPDGTVKTFTASFATNGKDGVMEYVTQLPTDLDQAGNWKVQGYFEEPAGKWHTAVGKMRVRPNVG